MTVSFQEAHFPKAIMLTGVRWYVAYPLSTHHVAERMRACGGPVAHSPNTCWVVQESPPLEEACRRAQEAALRCLKQAIRRPGVPPSSIIDGSDAPEAAIKRDTQASGTASVIPQAKPGTISWPRSTEQAKCGTRPMLGGQGV